MNDDALLLRAIELAEARSGDGRHGPFGAVVVRDGEVVGEGWNEVVAGCDPTAHAEVMALRRAAICLGTHVLAGCTIYCSCEPCPMCLGAIYWARIERVVYACGAQDARDAGFDDAFIYDEMGRTWKDRSIAGDQRQRERGLEAFRKWRANPHRVEY